MKDFMQNLIQCGRTLGVGLSGGKDSVALLHYLKNKEADLGVKVVAITVEHGIRGESSLKDRDFCVELCKSLSVPIKVFSVNAPKLASEKGYTSEQAARILRYQCFFDAIDEGFCDVVATAHHQSDNVETVLFNLFRGASLSGVSGIDEKAYDGKIIRPMLKVAKTDILAYISENSLPYTEDESNQDTTFSRNFIRQEIMPRIEEGFPSAAANVEKFSRRAKSDDEYLYSLAQNAVLLSQGEGKIPVDLPYPIFSRCAVLALKWLGATKDFDNRHIDGLFGLTANQTGKRVSLLNGLYGVREHGYIVIRKEGPLERRTAEFSPGSFDFAVGRINIEVADGYDRAEGFLYFDLDRIPVGAVIRNVAVGDEFIKFDGKRVSLKKFLTDKKIPASKKATLKVVAKDDLIYIIVGVEISALVKITQETRRIGRISVTKETDYDKIHV